MADGHLLESALRVLQTPPGLLYLNRAWITHHNTDQELNQVLIDVCECLRAVLTPPGAQRIWDEAWKTFGGSSPTLEYVMTEEEENEWLLSDAMFSWMKEFQKTSKTWSMNASLSAECSRVLVHRYIYISVTKLPVCFHDFACSQTYKIAMHRLHPVPHAVHHWERTTKEIKFLLTLITHI